MAIHLVQRSVALGACQKAASSSDVIVLLGEGVAAIGGSIAALGLQNQSENLCATREDVVQRGLADRIPDAVTVISDDELVTLCAEHSVVVSWNQP